MDTENKEWRAKREASIRRWFCNNQGAVDLYYLFGDVSELADDVTDLDKPLRADKVAAILTSCLFVFATNELWDRWRIPLFLLILISINDWLDSEFYDGDYQVFLKERHITLAHALAYICGGYEHMRSVSMEIRHVLDEWLVDRGAVNV